ncbi:MAG: aminodeoxychorismate/anthranilate synthase component II [Desulfamplus sp.]|nr:aminodeoxychorismate/anthranilate synthase component II [Desulfamplus sp.]
MQSIKPKLLVIDNYDSFTYNLVQMFTHFNLEIIVKRADKITIKEASDINPDYLLISPGPKDPEHAGISKESIAHFYDKIPILGVCLGMQCLNEVFGGVTKRAPIPVHGKTDMIYHQESGIFKGVPSPFAAARYHSLIIEPAIIDYFDKSNNSFTPSCEVANCFNNNSDNHFKTPQIIKTAWNREGIIMGVELDGFPIYGVQFHPESFMTEYGERLIINFLKNLNI